MHVLRAEFVSVRFQLQVHGYFILWLRVRKDWKGTLQIIIFKRKYTTFYIGNDSVFKLEATE